MVRKLESKHNLKRLLSLATLAITIFVTLATYPFWSIRYVLEPSDVMSRFERSKEPEEAQVDILLIAGPKMITSLIDYIADSSKPKRRYAILALGLIGGRPAVANLKSIAVDASEPEYIRRDALLALVRIDPVLGTQMQKSTLILLTEEDIQISDQMSHRTLIELLTSAYAN